MGAIYYFISDLAGRKDPSEYVKRFYKIRIVIIGYDYKTAWWYGCCQIQNQAALSIMQIYFNAETC